MIGVCMCADVVLGVALIVFAAQQGTWDSTVVLVVIVLTSHASRLMEARVCVSQLLSLLLLLYVFVVSGGTGSCAPHGGRTAAGCRRCMASGELYGACAGRSVQGIGCQPLSILILHLCRHCDGMAAAATTPSKISMRLVPIIDFQLRAMTPTFTAGTSQG